LNPSEPAKILITTSHNPTQTIRTFCNDLTRNIPNSFRINRGKSSLDALAEKALEHQATKIIIADRWKGGLGKIELFEVGNIGLVQYYPIIYVRNVKLRRDFGRLGKKASRLVVETADTAPLEARKLADAFSLFFDAPKRSIEDECFQGLQTILHVSSTQQHRIQITFLWAPQRVEIGPQVIVSHLVWKPKQ